MQVVGNSIITDIAEAVASRAMSRDVREWAAKAVARHMRRTEDLLAHVPDHKTLSKLMAADGIPTEAQQRIMVSFKGGEKVFMPAKDIKRRFLTRARDTMDWVNALVDEDRRIRRIDRMSWAEAMAQSHAWHAALAKVRKVSAGVLDGTRKVMDLKGGAFAVELETQPAFRAEGQNMGHCVGGYYNKYAAGQTRIISIRDANGFPHVTIELGAPPTVEVKGLGKVTVARVPSNGVGHLIVTEKNWRAVQVRGKGNAVPVPRWLECTWEYLNAQKIAWVEEGYRAPELVVPPGSPLVFTVNREHYSDPVEAMKEGERSVLADVKKGQSFKFSYEHSGLSQIHAYLAPEHPEAVEDFLNAAMPVCLGRMKKIAGKGAGGGLQTAIRESGVAYVMKKLAEIAPGSALEQRSEFMRMVVADDPKDVASESKPLVTVAGAKGLDVVVHRVPFTSLMLLAGGMVEGIEAQAIDHLKPYLQTVIKRMEERPAAIHAIVPAEGGSIPRDDVHKAFLASGLAMEFAKASAAVDAGIRGVRGTLVHALKQARAKGKIEIGEFNRSMNTLADGYETRVQMMAQEIVRGTPFFVGVSPPKAVPRPAPSRGEPLMLYRGEGRSPIAASVRMR